MREVVAQLQREALPFFQSTATVGGLLNYLSTANWGSQHHLDFERGCCLAKLGRTAEAINHLRSARDEYAADPRDWCTLERQRVEELLEALAEGTASGKLRTWTADSKRSLNLDRLL